MKAFAAAAKRKAIAKAIMQASQGAAKVEDSKRLRSPNMLSTPSTSTPEPKIVKENPMATPKKMLFEDGTPSILRS